MLSREDNELMCRVGAGTPMGTALRRFWIPALQVSDIPTPDCDPFPLEILGEQLVAFRDTSGKVGVLDEHCCHRGASLVCGRVEHGGIRCLFHGWKFAVDGTVLETPNVNDPGFKDRIKAKSYPLREAGGLIWIYLGKPSEEPEFPHHPWFDVPDSNRNNAYLVENGNYVQVIEALVDSSHLNILHTDGLRKSRGLEGLNFAAAADMEFDSAPRIEVDETDFGFHYAALRGGTGEDDPVHARITAFIAPFAVANPNEDLWMGVVPINDTQSIHFHVWWHVEKKMGEEPLKTRMIEHVGLDQEALRGLNLTYDTLNSPDKPSRSNRYRQNRQALKEGKFSGFHSFTQEDSAMILSMGPIKDRSKELMAPVDMAVMRLYRTLIQMAKDQAAGKDPVGLHADPMKIFGRNGTLPHDVDWRSLVPSHNITRYHRGGERQRGATAAAE